jgi:hypothetical protein
MRELKLVRLFGACVLLAAAPVLGAVAVYAQKSPSETGSSAGAPGAAPPGAPMGQTGRPAGAPSDPADAPAAPSKKGAAPAAIDPIVPPADQKGAQKAPEKGGATAAEAKPVAGLAVMAADGQRVGEVIGVKSTADGKVDSIQVKTGGVLGFGGRMVSIPPTKFTVAGQNVQLSMTSAEVAKLPPVEAPQG